MNIVRPKPVIIKTYKELIELLKQDSFEVRIHLGFGICTYRNIYSKRKVYDSSQDCDINFKSEKEFKKYWNKYIKTRVVEFLYFN